MGRVRVGKGDMTKNSRSIDLYFKGLTDTVAKKVPVVVSETAVEYYQERFLEKNWYGQPWPKYNPNNNPKRKEPTKGSLMMRSNALFQSVRPSVVKPGLVRISAGNSKVPYARIHNEGGRIRGVQYVRPHKRNSKRYGRKNVRGHSRKVDFWMPKRQFMGTTRSLNNRIRSRVFKLL